MGMLAVDVGAREQRGTVAILFGPHAVGHGARKRYLAPSPAFSCCATHPSYFPAQN